MNIQSKFEAVVSAMIECGYGQNHVELWCDPADGEADIEIGIDPKWRVSVSLLGMTDGTTQIYVNGRHDNGDFMCLEGSTSVSKSMLNLGRVIQFLENANDRKGY